MKTAKVRIHHEIAFCVAMLINSLSVVLIVKSNLGVSTLSSIPTILSVVFTTISFGTWNMLFQVLLMLLLVLLIHKPILDAILSMIVSIIFGMLLDIFYSLVSSWPSSIGFSIAYFFAGACCMAFGASLFLRCHWPILPLDNFVKDITNYYHHSYKLTRTSIDTLFVLITILLSLYFLGEIRVVGIGTIILALCMGTLMSKIMNCLDKYIIFI